MVNWWNQFCAYRLRHLLSGNRTLSAQTNRNLRHTALFELVTSSLTKGIQMGEIYKAGYLIGLVRHAIWTDSLKFLYLLLLLIPKILASSRLTLRPSSQLCWANFYFSRRPSLRLCPCSTIRTAGCMLFRQLTFVTFAGNAIYYLLLPISFLPGFHVWTKCLLWSLYTFGLLWNTLHICDIDRAQWLLLWALETAGLEINNWVNEIFGKTVKLKTKSQETNFNTLFCEQKNSVPWVREQTILTERPKLVGELSANFCGWRESRGQSDESPWPYSRLSRPVPILCLPSSSSIILTRMSVPRSRPTTSQKIW
jgi:hypothetical protein